MSWLGFGFIATHSPRLHSGVPVPPVSGQLTPSAQWDGTAASGFASLPTDPLRTTAKPALRLITPPNRHFTNSIDVIAVAAANNNGTLGADWGIEAVDFLYEGNNERVNAPEWHSINTERGFRLYFGWRVRLGKPATAMRGAAQLYMRAIPRDATMQSRVMGPYNFSPADTQHDLALTIAPSQPVIAGKRYQTLHAAASYARSQNAQNPLFTATEPGIYNCDGPTISPSARDITGRYTFRAGDGITGVIFGKNPDYVFDGDDNSRKLDSQQTWWHIAGSNLTCDWRNVTSLGAPVLTEAPWHWMDGVTITSSDPRGKNELQRGRSPQRTSQLVEGEAWMTEVFVTGMSTPFARCGLVRGCVGIDIAQDVFSNSLCVVNSETSQHDQTFFNGDTSAFTVQYAGAEPIATLSRSGGNMGTNGGLWTAIIGATTYTFDTGTGGVDYFNNAPGGGYRGTDGVGGYTVGDVIDWLNALPDVTATLTPGFERDERVACASSLVGLKGQGFGGGANQNNAIDLRNATTIVWNVNTHGDWYQHAAGRLENVIFAFNRGWDLHTQPVFLSPILSNGVASTRDVFFIGNSHANDEEITDDFDYSGSTSSIKRPQELGHVVFAHNTFANSGMLINTSQMADEGYSLLTNCSYERFVWQDDVPLAGFTVQNSGIHSSALVPPGVTKMFQLGAKDTLYANRLTGDFTPSGLARTLGFAPAITSDKNRIDYPALAAVGAFATQADVLYVPPEPGDNLGPQGDALVTLLVGKANSGMWFHEDARLTNNEFDWPSTTGGLGAYFQGTANRIPLIDDIDGVKFGSTKDNQILLNASGTFTVMMLMRKHPDDTTGYPVQNLPARLYAPGTQTLAETYVDGVRAPTRLALHDALDDNTYHSVRIPALLVGGELQVGRTSSSMWADVLAIVVFDHAEFTDLASVVSQANGWFDELKP